MGGRVRIGIGFVTRDVVKQNTTRDGRPHNALVRFVGGRCWVKVKFL